MTNSQEQRFDDNFTAIQQYISDSDVQRSEKIDSVTDIREIFKGQFDCETERNHFSTWKLSGNLLFSVMWRERRKFVVPDFDVKVCGSGGKKIYGKIIKAAILDALKEGSFYDIFESDAGIRHRCLLYGDDFVEMGIKNGYSSGFPTIFRHLPVEDAYFDNAALQISGAGGIMPAQFAGRVLRMTKRQFVENFPDFEGDTPQGELPIDKNGQSSSLRNQDLGKGTIDDAQFVDVGIFWFLEEKNAKMMIYAGSEATHIKTLEGEEYPHFGKDNEQILPVVQFSCFPAEWKFYNDGVGHLLQDLHKLEAEITNHFNRACKMKMNAPIAYFGKRVRDQEIAKAIANLQKGISPMIFMGENEFRMEEVSPSMQNAIEAYFRLQDDITRRLQNMGFNLQDIEHVRKESATAATLRDEAQNNFSREIASINAGSFERVFWKIIADIKKYVDANDDTPVDTPYLVEKDPETGEKIEVGGTQVEEAVMPDGSRIYQKKNKYPTLGAIAELLRQDDIHIKISARSRNESSRSRVTEMQNRAEVIKIMAESGAVNGTAFREVMALHVNKLGGFEFTPEDIFGSPEQAPPPEGMPPPANGMPPPPAGQPPMPPPMGADGGVGAPNGKGGITMSNDIGFPSGVMMKDQGR